MLKAKDDLRDGIHMLLAAGLEGTWPLGPQEPVLTREEYMLLYTRVHSFVKRHVNGEATATLESDRAGHDNGEVLYRVAESELHASCQHCRWQVQTAQDPVEAYEAVFGRYLFNVKVRQLRHYFGTISRAVTALCHPHTRREWHALPGTHARQMLIGACNPML